jgi:hypothetical protein
MLCSLQSAHFREDDVRLGPARVLGAVLDPVDEVGTQVRDFEITISSSSNMTGKHICTFVREGSHEC